MSSETKEDIVIVFIPSLGETLQYAQQEKGAPLTESEVLKIRDEAACITMEREDAIKGTQGRGFIDVDPENCWTDWHRFLSDRTGTGPLIVLCIPGGSDLEEQVKPLIKDDDMKLDFQNSDPKVVSAFQFLLVNPKDEELESVSQHKKIVYISTKVKSADKAPETAATLLKTAASVLKTVGVPLKCDSSGIAHSKEAVIEIAEQLRIENSVEFWAALFQTCVQYPINSKTDLYTCGMHILGRPDVIISDSLLEAVLDDNPAKIQAAAFLFSSFCLYLLIECTETPFASGHTFRPAEDWPPIRVRWEECGTYGSESLYHNPYGMWRFAELYDSATAPSTTDPS
jgi:hypothetical protein